MHGTSRCFVPILSSVMALNDLQYSLMKYFYGTFRLQSIFWRKKTIYVLVEWIMASFLFLDGLNLFYQVNSKQPISSDAQTGIHMNVFIIIGLTWSGYSWMVLVFCGKCVCSRVMVSCEGLADGLIGAWSEDLAHWTPILFFRAKTVPSAPASIFSSTPSSLTPFPGVYAFTQHTHFLHLKPFIFYYFSVSHYFCTTRISI